MHKSCKLDLCKENLQVLGFQCKKGKNIEKCFNHYKIMFLPYQFSNFHSNFTQKISQQILTHLNNLSHYVEKISQCEDTSPSAFINFSFWRGPFPISLPLSSRTRCPLAYLHTFILKCLHTCIHIIEKTSNSYRNNAGEKLACHCIDQQQIEKQCW